MSKISIVDRDEWVVRLADALDRVTCSTMSAEQVVGFALYVEQLNTACGSTDPIDDGPRPVLKLVEQ